MFTFSRAHSHALTNATRRHEYFRGLSRLLPVPGVLVSFLELRFLGKMALLALGGRPQPLKKPSQSQKGHFYEKMNALNDTKTSELLKSAEVYYQNRQKNVPPPKGPFFRENEAQEMTPKLLALAKVCSVLGNIHDVSWHLS